MPRMERWLRLALAGVLGCLLAGCAAKTEEEEEETTPQGRVEIVGRVASMPPGRNFVLIQSFGDWRVPEGTILTTRGADERSASLVVTGERLGQFAAADIRAGEVQVGDAVLRLPAVPPPTPEPDPAAAPEPSDEVDDSEEAAEDDAGAEDA